MMQPPPAPVFSMNHSFSFPPVGIGEETQPTQMQTQEEEDEGVTAINRDLWGYLIPCNGALVRVEFHKDKNFYALGRHPHHNDITLPGHKISNKHCMIKWNGHSDNKSEVLVHDTSSNGTFINGVRIGKGKDKILSQGDEIGFGTGVQASSPDDDFRFIYRHQGLNVPLTGVFIDYDVRGELGKGSFATVLRATHRATGQVFAVKLINTKRFALSANQSTAKMFIREIEILLELHHPNIVSLRQIFEDSSSIALVMEYIRGGDLLDFILRRGGISEHETAHLTRQMCEAMSYIHSKGIAHRDLKPENVLLTDTNPVIAKIADFGLAKAVDSGTFLKTMCGTPSYLAPEVVSDGDQHGYNHLVDSWSMGVIVFSMLTNTSPFMEEDDTNQPVSLSTRIQNRSVEWAFLAPARVTQTCYDFIKRLLTNDPKARMSLTEALGHPWLRDIEYKPAEYPPHAIPTGLGDWGGASGLVKGLRQGYGVGGGNGMGERHTNGTGPSGFTNGAVGVGMLPRHDPSQRSTVSPPSSSARSSILPAPFDSMDAISPPPTHHAADAGMTSEPASEGIPGALGFSGADGQPVAATHTLDMRNGFQNLRLLPDGSVAGDRDGDVPMSGSGPNLADFPIPPPSQMPSPVRPSAADGPGPSSDPSASGVGASLQVAGPPGTRNGKRIGKQPIFDDIIPDSQPPAPSDNVSPLEPPKPDPSRVVLDPPRTGVTEGDHTPTPPIDGEDGLAEATPGKSAAPSLPASSVAPTASSSSISTCVPTSSADSNVAPAPLPQVTPAPAPPATSNDRKRKAPDDSGSDLSSPPEDAESQPPATGAKGKGKARGKAAGAKAKTTAKTTAAAKKAPAKGRAAAKKQSASAEAGDAEGEGSGSAEATAPVPVRRSSRRQAPFKSQRIS